MNVDPSTVAPRVVILANGRAGAFEEYRAKALAGPLLGRSVTILLREYGTLGTWRQWKRDLAALRPQVLYSINTALPAIPFALLWARRHRVPFLLDTGDLVYEMARRSGVEPAWRWPLLWAGEQLAWRWSDTIVVRSTCFQDFLKARGFKRVEVIRDGYHPGPPPLDAEVRALKKSLGLEGSFVVGVMGSLVWSPRLQICYGWDLVRALALLKDQPVRGLIIGDGDGRPKLELLAQELGVKERLVFTGRIPYDQVPPYLRVMDVALSTQTNNLPGRIRTTGKVPEYMAAGRFILASRVGEAVRLLPDEMLVEYIGEVDEGYPQRIAYRVRQVQCEPAVLSEGTTLPAIISHRSGGEVLRGAFAAVVAGEVAGAPRGA